jgi:KaiC/GvpD/RAD55 family RecA-like ATPase
MTKRLSKIVEMSKALNSALAKETVHAVVVECGTGKNTFVKVFEKK